MNKAIFLDRDGVICEDTHYITSCNKLMIFDFAKKAITQMKEKGYIVIAVSNQSGIARGMMTEEDVDIINREIIRKTNVDKIYYCPHLPPVGMEVLPYRINCDCRKPNIGMIEKASYEYNIDMKNSYLVGDRESDILAARNAGLTSVLVMTGKGMITKEKTENYNYLYENILDFALEL